MRPTKGNGLDAANDQPAKAFIENTDDFTHGNRLNSSFPIRHNTVTADVLCRLLKGDRLTGMEAVFSSSTTRLGGAIHYLGEEYGWDIDRVNIDVGTNDGRVATVRLYFLGRSVIRRAFDAGALEFCRNVTDARAKTRKQAPKARAEADKRNAARAAARFNPYQDSLFTGSGRRV